MPNRIEEMTSKVAGKAGAAAASLKGLRGVFSTLAEQHKEVSVLLKRALSSDDSAKRVDLWKKIRAELLSHEQAELREVYPQIQGSPELDRMVRRHTDEASQLEALIKEIDITSVDSGAWAAMVRRLEEVVKAHVEEEENEFFPRAQEAIGPDAARDIDDRFQRTKKSLMQGQS